VFVLVLVAVVRRGSASGPITEGATIASSVAAVVVTTTFDPRRHEAAASGNDGAVLGFLSSASVRPTDVAKADVIEFACTGIAAAFRVRLRPDLSQCSSEFLREAASSLAACTNRSNLYRAEAGFLLQGRLDCPHATAKVAKGPCPPGSKMDPRRKCFAHDPNCGCHGPVMTRGMVGWAGGGVGPDFFVYVGQAPARHWQHDHTVFGEVEDAASWNALETILSRPAQQKGGMKMLETPLDFSIRALTS